MIAAACAVSEVWWRPPFSIRNGGCPPGPGVELVAVAAVLIADEVDVVVVGRVGDLQPVDHEVRDALAEPTEDVIDRAPPVWIGEGFSGFSARR
jgi:hypothetical protein